MPAGSCRLLAIVFGWQCKGTTIASFVFVFLVVFFFLVFFCILCFSYFVCLAESQLQFYRPPTLVEEQKVDIWWTRDWLNIYHASTFTCGSVLMHRIIFHNFDAKLPMTHRLWQVLNYAKTRTVLLCRLMAPPSIMQIPCKQQLPANVINLHLRRINVLSSNQPNFRYIDRKWLKMAAI